MHPSPLLSCLLAQISSFLLHQTPNVSIAVPAGFGKMNKSAGFKNEKKLKKFNIASNTKCIYRRFCRVWCKNLCL